jgi:hypothetical protein
MTKARHLRLANKWVGLQRVRALTLASLRDINEQIEEIRPELQGAPLDGYTIKLGGTDDVPGIFGLWLERYLSEAVAKEIISEDDLVAA